VKALKLADKSPKSLRQQAGGFVMGLVAGLLIGLAVALAVALYITKAPNLFVNKVPQRTAEQDSAETERNRNWDPNAPLSGKAGARAAAASASAASAAVAAVAAASAAALPASAAPSAAPGAVASSSAPGVAKSAKDPAAILAGGGAAPAGDPFVYFVQTGAYTRSDDAEQQKAKLALIGLTARVTDREQAGRTVYRVRLGPYPTRDEADSLQAKLQEQTIEAQIVRVEKP
jgi:cell division protein FtsN